VLNLEIW